MIATDPNAIAQFRKTTTSHVHFSHVRKRCACDRVVTSIQLQRYGMCQRCYAEKPK